jgi:hypothetical protein
MDPADLADLKERLLRYMHEQEILYSARVREGRGRRGLQTPSGSRTSGIKRGREG